MAYQPKSYRKFLAGSVSAALVATAVGPVVANAASFSDVNPNDSHAANINALVELGYIKGFADGTFKPYQSITRGQVAKIFARILTDQGFKAPDKIEQVFDDVPLDAKDQELVKAAAIVKAAGVMTGSQGKLNPAQNITREQMAKVLVEAFDLTRPADFKSKITDLDKADPSFRDYIQTLEANEVTVVTEYRPKDSVTRAAFASFVKRALDAQKPVTVEAEVASVSAINNTTFELNVTFKSEVTEELLKGTKLTLTGPVTVTATFSKLDGQTAVYKVDNVGALQPGNGSADGTYKVTSTSVKVPEGTVTTYSEVLKGNQVKGFVYDGTKPVVNATVEIDGRTVKTDSYGFYSIATNSGLRTVKVTAPGYFASEAKDVKVSRNYVTAHNFNLTPYDQKKLYVSGVVLNDTNSNVVQGATVELYEKNGSEWKLIDVTNTGSNGAFDFGNSNSKANNKFELSDGSKIDELELDKDYKVVIKKPLSAENFDDVYHEKTVEFKLNQYEELTNLKNVFVTPVKEIDSFTFDVTWSAAANTANPNGTTLDVALLNTDGETVLEDQNVAVTRSTTDTRLLAEPYDLAKKGFFVEGSNGTTVLKPRIPSGQYFLRVWDGVNAIAIIPVQVTEGQAVVAPKTEIQVAKSANVKASINQIQYSQALQKNQFDTKLTFNSTNVANFLGYTTPDTLTTILGDHTARANNNVTVDYKVTQNVNGVNVVVTEAKGATFVVSQAGTNSLTDIRISSAKAINYLDGNVTYTITPVSDYVKGSSFTNKPSADINEPTVSLTTAAKVNVVTFDSAALNSLGDGDITFNNIELISKTGQKVAETGSFTIPASRLKDADGLTAAEIVNAGGKELAGFTPGEYKIRVSVAGFKAKDTDVKTVLDFEEAQYNVKGAFEAIPKTSIKGYIRFADNNQNVADNDTFADATVIVYDVNGKIVAANNFGTSTADTVYTIVDDTNGQLTSGTYKLVVRGEGFETLEKEITIKENEENIVNLEVTRGGKGKAKLAIRDENNNALDGSASVVLKDKYWVSTTNIGPGVPTLAFDGEYDLTRSGSTSVEWTTAEALSKGDYSLTISSDNTIDYTDTITIKDINDTYYDVITVLNKVSGKTVDLTVKYADDNNDIDFVVVKKDGKIITTGSGNAGDGNTGSILVKVGANDTYTVEVYSNGKFVGSNEVTVQDFAKSVTVALDDAERD